jgi:general secretion pathway protein C
VDENAKLFERTFPLLVLGLLAASAFLLARGASVLIETALLAGPESLQQFQPSSTTLSPLPESRTGQTILARNPFDSATGPLTQPAEPWAGDSPEPESIDPLTAPACAGIQVSSTAVSADPSWSSAVIRGPGEQPGRMLRAGEAVGELKVLYIGDNPLTHSPTVWLTGAAGLCQGALFNGTDGDGAKPREAAPPVAPPPAPDSAKRRGPAPLPKQLAAKISRVNPTEIHLDRSAVDEIMTGYVEMLRGSRAVPVQREGVLVGFQLDRIGPDSLLGRLGFQNGDRVEAINGLSITGPDEVLQAYMRLRTASDMSVRVNRGGSPMTIDYRIR